MEEYWKPTVTELRGEAALHSTAMSAVQRTRDDLNTSLFGTSNFISGPSQQNSGSGSGGSFSIPTMSMPDWSVSISPSTPASSYPPYGGEPSTGAYSSRSSSPLPGGGGGFGGGMLAAIAVFGVAAAIFGTKDSPRPVAPITAARAEPAPQPQPQLLGKFYTLGLHTPLKQFPATGADNGFATITEPSCAQLYEGGMNNNHLRVRVRGFDDQAMNVWVPHQSLTPSTQWSSENCKAQWAAQAAPGMAPLQGTPPPNFSPSKAALAPVNAGDYLTIKIGGAPLSTGTDASAPVAGRLINGACVRAGGPADAAGRLAVTVTEATGKHTSGYIQADRAAPATGFTPETCRGAFATAAPVPRVVAERPPQLVPPMPASPSPAPGAAPATAYGMVLEKTGPFLRVTGVVNDSPAWKNYLRAGDLITSINGKPVRGMSINEARSALDAATQPVKITARHQYLVEDRAFDLTKAPMPVNATAGTDQTRTGGDPVLAGRDIARSLTGRFFVVSAPTLALRDHFDPQQATRAVRLQEGSCVRAMDVAMRLNGTMRVSAFVPATGYTHVGHVDTTQVTLARSGFSRINCHAALAP